MKTVEKQDYETAGEQAQALFASLNLTAHISPPMPAVEDQGEKPWPHIAYHVQIVDKAGRTFSTDYHLGVGHVKWARSAGMPSDVSPIVETRISRPHAEFKDKFAEARAAAWLARAQKFAPVPWEVLAACCEDGQSANQASFAEWAGNYSYNADSIKAKTIYDKCNEVYHQVKALIGAENVAKFAELHCQL